MKHSEAEAAQARAAALVRELAGLLAYRGTAAHVLAQERLREIRDRPELAGAGRDAAEQEVHTWFARESSMEFTSRARAYYSQYGGAAPATAAAPAPAAAAFAPSFTEVKREFALAELRQMLEARNLPLNAQLGEQVLLAVIDFVDECSASTLQSLHDLNGAAGVRHIWTEANRSLIEGVVSHISAELDHLGAVARAGLAAVRETADARDLVFGLLYEYAELDKAVRTARKNLAELRQLLHAVWQYAAGTLAGLAIEAPPVPTLARASAATAAAMMAATKAASAAASARALAEAEVLAAMTSVEFDPGRVIAEAAAGASASQPTAPETRSSKELPHQTRKPRKGRR